MFSLQKIQQLSKQSKQLDTVTCFVPNDAVPVGLYDKLRHVKCSLLSRLMNRRVKLSYRRRTYEHHLAVERPSCDDGA